MTSEFDKNGQICTSMSLEFFKLYFTQFGHLCPTEIIVNSKLVEIRSSEYLFDFPLILLLCPLFRIIVQPS